MVVMLASLGCGALFTALEVLAGEALPYAGILYVLSTGGIVIGFLLVPLGALLQRSRLLRGSQSLSEFRMDLRNREHRVRALAVLAGAALVLTLVPVGAYQSFQATESLEFCGQLCHEVMNPEWVRYQDSPHARVNCVECHIGPERTVVRPLSGLRQVWAVATTASPPHPHPDSRPAPRPRLRGVPLAAPVHRLQGDRPRLLPLGRG
jgi:hypothetical protein